ncbi:DNA-binding protein RHL1 isoform X2 [Aristolochia californica]|uniref:DNA-binding protein RHL1 isoform X2 n=1 Tax=Aristolochia californica TaxID=171875 RepID=UPI0035D7B903
MVRPSSKKGEKIEKPQGNDDSKERRRLKELAFSKNLLSQTPTKSSTPLNPSKLVCKHHGVDVIKKGQRKNKFLFSFPGLLAPVSGGKIGELKDLGTKNPILYMDFPQGRMKLFGTIVYPKNKYLTLHFGRTAKSVMCEDIFESMIVFSDARWIGKTEENPDELQLEFPKELSESKQPEYDFKGGAGAMPEEKSGVNKVRKEQVQPVSPESDSKDVISVDSDPSSQKNLNERMELTPVRHSARTAGKKFKFAESSSGDDNAGSDEAEACSIKEEKDNDEVRMATKPSLPSKTVVSNIIEARVHASDNEEVKMKTVSPRGLKRSSSSKEKTSELPNSKRGRLVQATLSTLFEKVEEKRPTRSTKNPPSPKDKETPRKRKCIQVEDDEIEFSSEPQDTDGSDDDWAA